MSMDSTLSGTAGIIGDFMVLTKWYFFSVYLLCGATPLFVSVAVTRSTWITNPYNRFSALFRSNTVTWRF